MRLNNSTAVIGILLALMALAITGGCREKAPQGEVKATAAYVEAFGEPPTPQQGSCFARVGYLPLKRQPDKVAPVPLFLFSEKRELFQLTKRLVDMEHFTPLGEKLFNPFPSGTDLQSVTREGNAVTVDLAFSGEQPTPDEITSLSRAIASTMAQFPEITKTVLLSEGQTLPGVPAGGISADISWRADPGNPALLLVVGNWEENERLKEILINFDRPVEVERIEFNDAEGRRIEGEYFHSAFDMAVVVQPTEKGKYVEGTALKVGWTVVDRLGRRGSGEGAYRLVRHEHRDERKD